jgi:hypothetical protein
MNQGRNKGGTEVGAGWAHFDTTSFHEAAQ